MIEKHDDNRIAEAYQQLNEAEPSTPTGGAQMHQTGQFRIDPKDKRQWPSVRVDPKYGMQDEYEPESGMPEFAIVDDKGMHLYQGADNRRVTKKPSLIRTMEYSASMLNSVGEISRLEHGKILFINLPLGAIGKLTEMGDRLSKSQELANRGPLPKLPAPGGTPAPAAPAPPVQ